MEQKFIAVAQHYKCDYEVNNYTVDGNVGAKIPISIYTLTLSHKDVIIYLKYELGNYNLAEVKFRLYTKDKIPEFHLETKDHFSRLFSLKKTPWIVKSKSKAINVKMLQLIVNTGLAKIANDAAFEPKIAGLQINKEYNFTTKFYLGFDNKEETIAPILEFNKGVIDYLFQSYWN